MASRTLSVSVRLFEQVAGLWCDGCALPSAVRFVLAVEVDGRPSHMVRVSRCRDCGEEV